MTILRAALVLAASAIAFANNAAAQNSLYSDLSAIVDTANSNELKFHRDYRGKKFQSVGQFKKASENPFVRGEFRVYVLMSGGVVDCMINDKNLLDRAVDWKYGQSLLISGNMGKVRLGGLELDKGCIVKEQ